MSVGTSVFNSTPKFDDFFGELSEKLKKSHALTTLIVTCPCPDFVKPTTPSILYIYDSRRKLYDYYKCIESISSNEEYHSIEVELLGLNNESFEITIHFNSEKCISDIDILEISYECNKILSAYLRAKILALRDYVVAMSLQTNDISSFFHKATTEGLRAFFSYDGASAFYHDYQTSSLVLAATTGISRLKVGKLRRADIKYHNPSKSWVSLCFQNGSPISEWAPNGHFLRPNTYGEEIPEISNRLYIPIDVRIELKDRLFETYGGQIKSNGRIGVLRIVNFRRNGLLNPISTIDFYILGQFSEYLAVLGARYIRVLSVIHDQEKSTHGFVTDLSTLRLRVQLLSAQISKVINLSETENERTTSRIIEIREIFSNFEKDFYAVQDGMAFQMQTVAEMSDGVIGSAGRDHPLCMKPFVEVVMRILHSREYICKNYGRAQAIVYFEGESRYTRRFQEMPPLKTPQRTFYLALRNLVENSIKYTPRDQAPLIDFRWKVLNGIFSFYVIDQGIGINESDVSSLFREGFRARNALREATRGNGLGLSVSRRGLRGYGGDVSYEGKGHSGIGSVFRIQIPVNTEGE